jgi:hypothetical protein
MFKVECFVWLTLSVILFVDVMNKVLVFIKFDDRFFLYNHNNPWIISFKIKVLSILAPLIKIDVFEYWGYFFFVHDIIK